MAVLYRECHGGARWAARLGKGRPGGSSFRRTLYHRVTVTASTALVGDSRNSQNPRSQSRSHVLRETLLSGRLRSGLQNRQGGAALRLDGSIFWVIAAVVLGVLVVKTYGEYKVLDRRLEREAQQQQREARQQQREFERATDELNDAERELRRELRRMERARQR